MTSALVAGIAATALGGGLNGGFILPMRKVRGWQWEHTWLGFGIFGLVLLPFCLALCAVPHLFSVYAAVPFEVLVLTLILGIAWGIGSLLFGLGISALGMSLGYSIIMGTSTICGTIIPAFVLSPSSTFTGRGMGLLASVVLISASLVLFAIAGKRRSTLASGSTVQYQILRSTSFGRGLLIAIVSGVLSACFNIGFAMSEPISATARQYGAIGSMATFSVWALIMGAGFLPNLGYCLFHIRQRHSSALFKGTYWNWWHTFAMAILWVAGVALYGVGTDLIGHAGAAIGWPILMSMTIFTANVSGIASGEWKSTWGAVNNFLISGLALLVVAVIVAGIAGAH